MKNNSKKAVSLMVLIITIIIMTILSGTVIISLNNAGVINRSKDAVSQYNLKQVEELSNIAWGEAYLLGKSTVSALRDYVIDYLDKNGVDTHQYEIKVTKQGVEVEAWEYADRTWEKAWTYTDGVWSEEYVNGAKLEGDIFAKLYKNGDNTYDLVIEGVGTIKPMGRSSSSTEFPGSGSEAVLGLVRYDVAYNSYINKIKHVTIREGIENIPEYAFANCTNLQTAKIADSVTSIGQQAFCYTALESVQIPDAVTSISPYCFTCTNIQKLELGKNIKTIDPFALYFCPSLSAIKIYSNNITVGNDAFMYLPQGSTIYVLNENIKTLLEGKYDAGRTTVQVVAPAQMDTL